MKGYTLEDLPRRAQNRILETHEIENLDEYRAFLRKREQDRKSQEELAKPVGLFASMAGAAAEPKVSVKKAPKITLTKGTKIIWGTDSYAAHKLNPLDKMDAKYVKHIIPRSEKAREEQKKRTKDKAEVFTPSWVCNAQNNLVDDAILYEGAFNRTDLQGKSWIPTLEPVDFSRASEATLKREPNYSWAHYVLEHRLEITCGEGPYLMSRYDTVSGDEIPVRNAEGAFQRIGFLDRKFRVIAENTIGSSKEEWIEAGKFALRSTYGYEWQGDNLLLARLNFLNSFVDYYKDFLRTNNLPDENLSDDVLVEIAEIASWQLWQMDGLKLVTPMSCAYDGEECVACKKKFRVGHHGKVPVILWNGRKIIFEEIGTLPELYDKPKGKR